MAASQKCVMVDCVEVCPQFDLLILFKERAGIILSLIRALIHSALDREWIQLVLDLF